MASPQQQQHFLFVTDPMQSHVNPARRLAARVAAALPNARVTFSTAVSGHRQMFPHLTSPDGEVIQGLVSYIPYSDGFDGGFSPGEDARGRGAPATVFAVYYYYFHGHGEALHYVANSDTDPEDDASVHLPGLPPLKPDALPCFASMASPGSRHYLTLDMLRDIFFAPDEHMPTVLVDTFDALEYEALRALPQFDLVAV
ncbi:hypothetical protein EJB05_41414, partial [Eragrostis curvula]